MKKLLTLLLAVVYLGASAGATVHLHYCMDELIYLGFDNYDKEECGKCGMKKAVAEKGCCKDEHKQLKLQDSKKAPGFTIDFLPNPILALTPGNVNYWTIAALNALTPQLSTSHAPPLAATTPVYLFNCVFRV